MIQVVCWLWDDPKYRWNKRFRYTYEHVNNLRAMVRRHLHIPHEFVCITDDPSGVDHDIRIIPLWDDLRELGGCYVRLKVFSETMRDIIGHRFVSMDLDAIICKDITPLISRQEPFIAIANKLPGTYYCGSMFMMDAGARKEVWEKFDYTIAMEDKKKTKSVGTDQAWISYWLGKNESTWGRLDGVCMYYRLRRRETLPGHVKMVFFSGPYDPSQPHLQQNHPWIGEHWHSDLLSKEQP